MTRPKRPDLRDPLLTALKQEVAFLRGLVHRLTARPGTPPLAEVRGDTHLPLVRGVEEVPPEVYQVIHDVAGLGDAGLRRHLLEYAVAQLGQGRTVQEVSRSLRDGEISA